MIRGIHAILYAQKADATRRCFEEVLELPSVDAGGGWSIFALPPAELGVHPTDDEGGACELYLMCDDLPRTMAELTRKGVRFEGPVREMDWGSLVMLHIPGGGTMGMYQPKHPTAIGKHHHT